MFTIDIVSDFDGVSHWQLKDGSDVLVHGTDRPSYKEAYDSLQEIAKNFAELLGFEVSPDAKVPLKALITTNTKVVANGRS